ncbi:MAG: sulfite exporter TauE/SafE family protein [Ruminococcaceae bacterium]|nr:sulfite exporter TauE/SafE family protein [Oscillospiraceae bacterium]
MVWWIIATVFAFFVKGLCGFANTLVFNTILSFDNTNINISPVELVLGYPTNAILVWHERNSIKWRICLPLSLMVIIGCIPGALFLKNVDVEIVKIVFGFVIILIGLEMLFRGLRSIKIKQSKTALSIIGILSGVLCGLYGIGALLGAYVNRVTDDTGEFRANMCVVFLVENTFRVILYIVSGIITLDILKQALILVPFMLIGLGIGMISSKVIDEKIVKKIVIVMLIISGVALVMNNLW